jgi:FtsP/CotA-like multicopper oxidase with cupredoxin domain
MLPVDLPPNFYTIRSQSVVKAISSGLALSAAVMGLSCRQNRTALPDPPVVRSQRGVAEMTLTAARKPDGHDTFVFDGLDVPPTVHLAPGDTLKIHYVNALPGPTQAAADSGPMHMTNLHFHGLTVSPLRPQDDVLNMIAMPGEALDYTVTIPRDHMPGLYWYHTHPHGESNQQVLDGMSGALIIDGIEQYAPAVRSLRERVLVIRATDIEHDPNASAKASRVGLERSPCGESRDKPSRLFTVNGILRPEIDMQPGEPQFWRIVNAASDRYVDVDVAGRQFTVIAYDGAPIAHRDPAHPTRLVDHVLLPPAARVEAIVDAPKVEGRSVLRTRCVDSGPDGDPHPGMVLADVVVSRAAQATRNDTPPVDVEPTFKVVNLEDVERQPPVFTAVFTEGDHKFYINDHLFSLDDVPMVRAKVGEFQHWKIVNKTKEIHPMHMHQAHFLAFAENDRPLHDPVWLDTVNVAVDGSVDVVMDFTNPVIRGMAVFHCHLLNHEDKGMMAKILFE